MEVRRLWRSSGRSWEMQGWMSGRMAQLQVSYSSSLAYTMTLDLSETARIPLPDSLWTMNKCNLFQDLAWSGLEPLQSLPGSLTAVLADEAYLIEIEGFVWAPEHVGR
jgi:hypothetical protein